MEAVGGSVLSTTLQVLFDRIALNNNFILFLYPRNKKLQLKRLEKVLQIVSPVLQDAENKQGKSPVVKTWFNGIKHAVYQADDVLDEINTDRLRIQLQHSTGNLCDTDFSDQFIGDLSPRLEEICDALEKKVRKIGLLCLRNLYGKQNREDRPPSTSVVVESEIFGRDEEKEKIIQMVLSCKGATNLSVIPITGMGGVGKTTLAQLVYNDKRVKNYCETRAWVCVSEEFDVKRATKDLLKEVNPSMVDERDDLDNLQVKLKDKLEGKRFIIILDDIWNDNYDDCQRLMTPLNSGSLGSKIIVTTRNENIALMLQNEPFHCLHPIPENQSWSLFKLHAFDNRCRTLVGEFETIGRKFMVKCKGLPLAIKTVACALRSKSDIREWRDILSSDNWMDVGDILPALSLSYKLLPSHLKCCFAFCAVFPKDVPFDKEEVTLLWMANDLVQPPSQKVAQNYFEELRSRSFFEMVNNKNYVMHDLINDLARIVSGNFCAKREDYQLKDLHRKIKGKDVLPVEALHFSYLNSGYNTLNSFELLAQVQGLRTFLTVQPTPPVFGQVTLSFLSYIVPKLRHIRTLHLHRCRISVIPDSIGDLKHLRLFNLGNNTIEKLPNDITRCLNLQTLILADCSELEELPEDMGLLIYLKHLDISRCSKLKKLPEDTRLLINLQHLEAILCLNLEKLPEGMGLLINLQHLDISGCTRLKELPKDMRLLINLQHLNIRGCSNLETLPEGMELLINLQHLDISDGASLRKKFWHFQVLVSSKLIELPKDMRLLINLQHLDISGCLNLEKLPEGMGFLINLQHLDISGCSRLKELPKDTSLLINLQHLNVSGCSNLEKLPEGMGLLINLQYLNISGCWRLKVSSKDMRFLSNLQHYKDRGAVDLNNGNTLEQLDKLELGQFLKILLDNVVTVETAKHAELKNKNCITNLILEWSDIPKCSEDKLPKCSEDELPECSEGELPKCSEDELNIFAELIPHTNIKQLSIQGYRGTAFSNWLGDSSFCNIESLTLVHCKNCMHLPPLGQLAGLKELHIFAMNGISEVGEEFYGNSSICKPFPVLEKLRLEKMAEWTTWSTPPDNAVFLSVKTFFIRDCPKLVGDIPFHLTSSGTLEMTIIECPNISLSLQSCDLKQLEMRNCKHFEFLTDDICEWSLESLSISFYGGSSAIPLFSKLQKFKFPNGYHQSFTSLQFLTISDCDNILSFPKGGLQAPNLKEFIVSGCKKLKSLPEEMHTQLSSLRHLVISACPEMECFPDGGLPHSLQILWIWGCKKLMKFPRDWGLQTLPSLTNLYIRGIKDKLFPEEGLLPASLKELFIEDCPNLEALNQKGFQDVTCLKELTFQTCRELRYLPAGLPSSLSDLDIRGCPKLKARIEREKGKDWPNVSHIRIIKVDGELIS